MNFATAGASVSPGHISSISLHVLRGICGFKGGNPYVKMCFPSSKELQIKSAEFFMTNLSFR